MTQFSILGPPRGGRRVKSEKEVLEESLSWPKESAPDVIPQPVIPVTETIPADDTDRDDAPIMETDYFRSLGRFNVRDITKLREGYVFHDLELPMGCWSELELSQCVLAEPPRDFFAWAKSSKEVHPFGVTPADVRYGLMAVCYQKKDDPKLRYVVDDIKVKVWLPDANKNFPHNSTHIAYHPFKNAIITPGVGWPKDHPFGARYHAAISGVHSDICADAATSPFYVNDALIGLLGENDSDRARSVLEWGLGGKPLLCRCGIDSVVGRVVIFGVNSEGGYIDLYTDGVAREDKPARMIFAQKKDFQPR